MAFQFLSLAPKPKSSKRMLHNHGVVFARFARRTASPLRGSAAAHADRYSAPEVCRLI